MACFRVYGHIFITDQVCSPMSAIYASAVHLSLFRGFSSSLPFLNVHVYFFSLARASPQCSLAHPSGGAWGQACNLLSKGSSFPWCSSIQMGMAVTVQIVSIFLTKRYSPLQTSRAPCLPIPTAFATLVGKETGRTLCLNLHKALGVFKRTVAYWQLEAL